MISTIYNVFSSSKKPGQLGVGESIIQTLTGFLKQIDDFATSVKGKAALGTLLTVHKNEALGILDMIPPIAKALATVYGAIAPGLVEGITAFIKGVTAAIVTLSKLKIGKLELGDWGVGLGLIALKLTGLGKVIGGLANALGRAALTTGLSALAKLIGDNKFGQWLSSLAGKTGAASFPSAVTEFAAAVTRFTASVGIGKGGVGAVGGEAGVAEESAIGGGIASKIAGALGTALAGATALAIGYAIGDAINPKLGLSKKIAGYISKPPPTALQTDLNYLLTLGGKKQTTGVQKLESADTTNIAAMLAGKTQAQMAAILAGLTSKQRQEVSRLMALLGMNMVDGVVSGVKGGVPKANAGIKAFIASVVAAANQAAGIKSPSTVFATLGRNLILGLNEGIKDKAPTVTPYLQNLWNAMLTYLKTLPSQMQVIGDQLMTGMAAGIRAGTPAAVAAAVAAAKAVEAATRSATGAKSPSVVYAAIGNDLMAGLAQGIKNGTSLAKSAMVTSLNTITPSAASLAGRGGVGGFGAVNVSNVYHITVQSTANPNSVVAPLKQAFDRHDADLIRRIKPGSTDQPLLLSRESAVAADGLVGCRSTGVGA
jgi:hypothetical protein